MGGESNAPAGAAAATTAKTANADLGLGLGYGGGDADHDQENLIAKFQTLSAEGDLLAQRGSYVEAIVVFTRALSIRPTDSRCLVARSKCYIYAGSPELALRDADACLALDARSFKGLFRKAEALYARGDFELALMYYHRGNRLRPELDCFRIGIQKSREAIENSIGDVHGHNKIFGTPANIIKRLGTETGMGRMSIAVNTVGAGGPAAPAATMKPNGAIISGTTNTNVPVSAAEDYSHYKASAQLTPAMESKLLGELFDDKCYLQDLLLDRDFVENPDQEVKYFLYLSFNIFRSLLLVFTKPKKLSLNIIIIILQNASAHPQTHPE
jgi:tetratricopeptide (TPR) repeat protein